MGTYKMTIEGQDFYLPVYNKQGNSFENPSNLLYTGNKYLPFPDISEFDISNIRSGHPTTGEMYGILPGNENGWESAWACPPVVIYDIGNNVKIAPAMYFGFNTDEEAWGASITFYVYDPDVSTEYWRIHGYIRSTYTRNSFTISLARDYLATFAPVTHFMPGCYLYNGETSIDRFTETTKYKVTIFYVSGGISYFKDGNDEIGVKSALTFTNETPEYDSDPFNPGGNTGTGGGGGNFDGTSVPVDFPSLPTISATSTGFVTIYSPTLSQLNELASYMWSDLFDIEGWKKLYADPMDAILGLSIVPVTVPIFGTSEVKVGNISTGISLNKAVAQYVEVDCGTINVNEYWGAYLDYSPYTKCEIFLPYVGTRPLSIDDVMNKTIHVKYHVDILSGGLTCFVKCGDSVLYSFIGQCSASIPINSANYTNMLNGVLNIAGSIGSTVATGGMMAPATAATITTTAFNMMKPEIQKSGAMSGAGAMLGMQTPYLVLTRPRQALPKNQNKFSGYPSLITVKLSELSGYTEIEKIHLENIPATEVELTELEKLLMGGVIF